MTFQHILLLGPCAYPGHINTAPVCTTSLKLVLVFICASNPLLLSLPSPLRKILVSKFFNIKNLHHSGLSVWRSSSCLSYFFSIAYWEDISFFVSIARPRSRKKGIHLCQASVPNIDRQDNWRRSALQRWRDPATRSPVPRLLWYERPPYVPRRRSMDGVEQARTSRGGYKHVIAK